MGYHKYDPINHPDSITETYASPLHLRYIPKKIVKFSIYCKIQVKYCLNQSNGICGLLTRAKDARRERMRNSTRASCGTQNRSYCLNYWRGLSKNYLNRMPHRKYVSATLSFYQDRKPSSFTCALLAIQAAFLTKKTSSFWLAFE